MISHEPTETGSPCIASAVPFITVRAAPDAAAGVSLPLASGCNLYQRIGEWELITPLQFIGVPAWDF
jgi:hypothetical protein